MVDNVYNQSAMSLMQQLVFKHPALVYSALVFGYPIFDSVVYAGLRWPCLQRDRRRGPCGTRQAPPPSAGAPSRPIETASTRSRRGGEVTQSRREPRPPPLVPCPLSRLPAVPPHPCIRTPTAAAIRVRVYPFASIRAPTSGARAKRAFARRAKRRQRPSETRGGGGEGAGGPAGDDDGHAVGGLGGVDDGGAGLEQPRPHPQQQLHRAPRAAGPVSRTARGATLASLALASHRDLPSRRA